MATNTLINWSELSKHINVQTLLVEIMAGGFRYLKKEVAVSGGAATLTDHAVQKLVLNDAQTTLSLPPEIPEGRVGDLLVYVENDYESGGALAEALVEFDDNQGVTYEIATVGGDAIDDVLTFAPGAKGVLLLTMTPLEVVDETGSTPVTKQVWVVTRQDIEIAEVSNS